ncbi:hypothetical protein EVAR_57349_1 [Eumeta japonica]|uniref:Uncharacterized protein n=1 Tax=Eumeta variegata TaxID=151549 RepID=A0A4C1Z559_EUMVA|nr:hypothetical protein EVAR_57349_1 [Eumeta japonica]
MQNGDISRGLTVASKNQSLGPAHARDTGNQIFIISSWTATDNGFAAVTESFSISLSLFENRNHPRRLYRGASRVAQTDFSAWPRLSAAPTFPVTLVTSKMH